MTAKVERIAGPLRAEVMTLACVLRCSASELKQAQAPRVGGLGYALTAAEVPTRAAWWLMGQWLLGYINGTLDADSTLDEAEDWFYGSAPAPMPRLAPRFWKVTNFSRSVDSSEVAALLPYLLDPLGPGTRRHVLGSDVHHPDRLARKTGGVYYTPADVARYMASTVAPSSAAWTCFDPACGSGVFLRAGLSLPSPAGRVFGCDIDSMAAEMAAFVIVGARADDPSVPAWFRWHLARLDLATRDALLIQSGTELDEFGQHRRREEVGRAATRLAAGEWVAPAEPARAYRSLGALFPALEHGVDVLLSNPPYAKLGVYASRDEVAARFESLAGATSASNVYTAFVEMAWHHTRMLDGAASVVVPLSVAFHGGQQYRALRRAMSAARGGWDCSFFDRTPDALFGDDVKTRNAILTFRAAAKRRCAVAVTGLVRWTSASRREALASLRHVEVSTAIVERLPKLGSAAESKLYDAVRGLPGYLNEAIVHRAKVPGAAATSAEWPHTLFVGPTAYNWFSCARNVPLELLRGHDSASALTALQFVDDETADIAYALIASRLVFWLWRVEGDAFHVSPSWLCGLKFPINRLGTHHRARLAQRGRELWAAAVTTPIYAVNKGKRTVAFPATLHLDLLELVDEAVIDIFNLRDASEGFDLDEWYRDTVVVDRNDNRRLSMAAGRPTAC